MCFPRGYACIHRGGYRGPGVPPFGRKYPWTTRSRPFLIPFRECGLFVGGGLQKSAGPYKRAPTKGVKHTHNAGIIIDTNEGKEGELHASFCLTRVKIHTSKSKIMVYSISESLPIQWLPGPKFQVCFTEDSYNISLNVIRSTKTKFSFGFVCIPGYRQDIWESSSKHCRHSWWRSFVSNS